MKNLEKFLLILIMVVNIMHAETVLATIGDQKITDQDLQVKLDGLPPQYVSFYSSKEGKSKLLEQLVQQKLFYLEAKAKNFEQDTDFQAAMEKMKEEVLTNYYLKKEMEKITISDKEINDYYGQNKDKYMAEASVKASHILVKEESTAKDLISKINAGESFEKLAKENSTCPSGKNGGDLGYFNRGQMVKPFEDAAFALNPGEMTTSPVQTQFGWHLIKVTDKKEAKQQDLAEIKGEIRSQLVYEKQKQKLNDLAVAAQKKYPVSKNEGNLNNF